MTMDEKIDVILKLMSNGDAITIYHAIEDHLGISSIPESQLIIGQMEYKNLIEEYGTNSRRTVFKISGYGFEIINEYGSWIKFLKENETEHRELLRMRTENDKFQKQIQTTNTRINRGLLIVAVISAILLSYGIFQTDRTNTLEKTLETVTKERDSLATVITDQNGLLKTKDMQIMRKEKLFDSLTNSLRVKK